MHIFVFPAFSIFLNNLTTTIITCHRFLNFLYIYIYIFYYQDVESDIPEPTDWERYAAEEYELLVAEEGANDQEEV